MAFVTSGKSDESSSTIVMCSCNGLLSITNLVINAIIYAMFWPSKNSPLKIQGSIRYAYHITSTTWLQCTKYIYIVINNKEKGWVGKKINVTCIKLISNFIKLILNLNHLVGGISPM